MKRWILALLVMLAASPGWSAPRVAGPEKAYGPSITTVVFGIGDTSDSAPIAVSGYCTVRYEQASGDDANIYAIASKDTATSAGTLLKAFTSSTSPSNPAYTFTASTKWVKVKAADATAGGSSMTIECSPLVGAGSGSGASCDTGTVMGGGYDSTTGLYDWTCGNYPFSASYGGMNASGESDFSSPTTAGGNSWTLRCTGDGTASNGTAAEGSICLANGEEIKMYAMADIMLAEDFTRPGGTVYLPDGIYHDRYCGQSESAAANGCPILRRSPGHQTRKISMSRGIKLVGSGQDPDGPHINGRGGVWLISDHGGDTDNDNSISDNVTDPGGTASYAPGHWAFRVGLSAGQNDARICARTQTSSACVTSSTAVRDQDVEPIASIGRTASLVADPFAPKTGATPTLCISNVASAGVCSGDPRVTCTVNDGTDRDSTGTTGGCSDLGLGSCVGVAAAVETLLEANADSETNGSNASSGLYAIISSYPQSDYGSDDVTTSRSQSVVAQVANVNNTTCDGGNGRLVTLGDYMDARAFYASTNASYEYANSNPVQFPVYDDAVQPDRVQFLTADKLFNTGGGYYGVNIMPGSWKDRRSATAAADCSNTWATTYEAACDDVDLLALGAGVGGGIYDSSVWYGGGMGGYAFSKIDGDTAGFATEAKRNLFARGYGLQSDASGWIFEDNTWMDINALSQHSSFDPKYIIAMAYSPGFRMTRDRFLNVSGASLFYYQGAAGSIIRDVDVQGGTLPYGILNIRGARRALVDGITARGIRGGAPIQINPQTDLDVFDVTVKNVFVENQGMYVSTQAMAKSMVWATDINSGGGDVTGPVTIENVSMSVHGDDSYCALFLDGGSGDESDAANGSGRTVDDWRHFLTFKNFNLERISDGSVGGSFQATCLGDASPTASGSNGPEDTLNQFPTSEGGMPRWEQIYLNGVMYPDNPHNSQTAASAGDCQNLVHGTVALIHDATVASTCTDAGADGVLDGGGTAPNQVTVKCSCNPAGDTGDGQWGVAF